MAYVTGTSANAQAFILRLHEIITSDATVVAEGSEWSVAWGVAPPNDPEASADIIYQGLGNDSQNIYVGVQYRISSSLGVGRLYFNGFQGVNSLGVDYGTSHNNMSPYRAISFPMDTAITYYISVNKRRITGVLLFNGVYQTFYVGFGLPMADVGEYPLPYVIAASQWSSSYSYTSSDTKYNRSFWAPTLDTSTSAYSLMVVMNPANEWRSIFNSQSPESDLIYPFQTEGTLNRIYQDAYNLYFYSVIGDGIYNLGIREVMDRTINTDGGPLLERTYIAERLSLNDFNLLFSLEGWSAVYGSVNPLDIITADTIDHLAIPSINDSTLFAAMEMR